MTRTPDDLRGQDVIDSRDVIARIEYLAGLKQEAVDKAVDIKTAEPDADAKDAASELWIAEDGTEYGDTVDWTEEEHDELKQLQSLAEEASSSPDWSYGEGLIKDSYFQEYAEQLAEDIGAISKNATWPNNHIDWDAAADALKQDYFSVELNGETYWIRA